MPEHIRTIAGNHFVDVGADVWVDPARVVGIADVNMDGRKLTRLMFEDGKSWVQTPLSVGAVVSLLAYHPTEVP